MQVIITKGQIEDIEIIAQFQVDMAMESEGTLFNKGTVVKGVAFGRYHMQAYESGPLFGRNSLQFSRKSKAIWVY